MNDRNAVAIWREEVGRHLLKLDFQPNEGGSFFAEVKPIFGSSDVRITRVKMSPGLTTRDSHLAGDGDPTFAFVIANRHPLLIAHGDRETSLRPGDATLMRNWKPGQMSSCQGFDYDAIIVSEKILRDVGSNLGRLTASPVPRTSRVLAYLRSYIRMIDKLGFSDNAAMPDISRHLQEQLRLLLSSEANETNATYSAPLGSFSLARIAHYIEVHATDPTLTVGKVAAAAGVSVRYLEYILGRTGLTYSARLKELRLNRVRQLIQGPEGAGKRIIDIAMESGFSDLSHFNRMYRMRFGEVPSKTRADAKNCTPHQER